MFDNYFENFEDIPFLMNNSFGVNNVLNEPLPRCNPYFSNDSFNYFEDNVDDNFENHSPYNEDSERGISIYNNDMSIDIDIKNSPYILSSSKQKINNDSILEENKHIDKVKKNNKEKTKSEVDNNDINHKKDKNGKNNLGKKRDRKHDKTAKDNILRKIQANYIKFLENLLNQINFELLQNYKRKEDIQFFPLNCKMKKSVTKDFLKELKEKTLGDIFKYNVSPKFKNYKKLNINVYNQITNKSKIIKTILNKTYLEFFYVYYLNKKSINLSKYGLKKTIILSSNIELYKDLLKKNISDIEYQKKIEKCIKTEFMVSDKPIFFVENK